MNVNITKKISQNIKKYRLLNKMTQEALAEKLDLDTQYYAQLERGERNFTIEKIVKICSIFNIGIENIIEINNKTKQDTNDIKNTICEELNNLTYNQYATLYKLKILFYFFQISTFILYKIF